MAKIRDRNNPPGLSHLDWDTDRYKLLSVLQQLDDNWLVWAGAACCLSCSGARIDKEESEYVDNYIFWHEQDEEMLFGPERLLPEHEQVFDEIYNEKGSLADKDDKANQYLEDVEKAGKYPWYQPDDFASDGLFYLAFEPDPSEALELLESIGLYTYWNGSYNRRPAVSPHSEMVFKAMDKWREHDETNAETVDD